MTIEMLYSKIHRATVTDANLNYVGSITIDEELMEEANLLVGQKVDIVNINNGERFSTYVIKGERGKRDICLNGAAARKVHPGDKIIIIAYASMTPDEAKEFKPSVLIVNDNNDIIEKTTYLQEG
ncbi:aspartate 1-decarboxylase [Nautilia sp. PV-1]|uniref:aspartate 1-decarboxylase n=1 Tax=Nautilia sp. PV-1 TaxID=2579250 RepID=UPI000FD7BAC6|nr:aspartate 1-decarboxylase [Nautilia sp. PV-1]AZV47352.1 aspartate 1-decarboxylase [Nautilia sp. PV-1]